VTIIAFIGSVFSPYYAWARRRGQADPRNHCAINVALYGRGGGKRWSLTERGRDALHQSAEGLSIGPSTVHWDGSTLTVEIRERAAPLPFPVRGTVRISPNGITQRDFALDEVAGGTGGRHHWWPIAPCARVEVRMLEPRIAWTGHGYLDMNAGDQPLEQGFLGWDWSRTDLGGETAILYDTRTPAGGGRSIAVGIGADGSVRDIPSPPRVPLPATAIWRIGRGTRCEPGLRAQVERTLEDTPFYARSLVHTQILGCPVTAMHESLQLTRFASPWVQLLLPFRMPRIARPLGQKAATRP
jgi:carotenoid 1,2-hydratase